MEAAMTDAGMTWTDERVELLAKLWSEGLSASQIAAELGGGVTRNAVIGKVHRLGLSGRGKAQAPATPRSRKPIRPADPDTAGEPPIQDAALLPVSTAGPQSEVSPEQAGPQDDVVVPLSERVTIMELRESMCRWPLGDPTTAEFRFCGAHAITGLPYCTHHARVAYQPAAERKRLRA
jgi:GcrA cell cycle regulator